MKAQHIITDLNVWLYLVWLVQFNIYLWFYLSAHINISTHQHINNNKNKIQVPNTPAMKALENRLLNVYLDSQASVSPDLIKSMRDWYINTCLRFISDFLVIIHCPYLGLIIERLSAPQEIQDDLNIDTVWYEWYNLFILIFF